MKRAFIPLLAVAISLGLVLLLATPTFATSGDHSIRQSKGRGTSTAWNLYDEVSGIQTDIVVILIDEQIRYLPEKPGGGPYLDIYIYQYYVDPYLPIRDIWFSGAIPQEGMEINHALSSASLILSGLEGEQYDYTSDAISPMLIDIGLIWSATGSTSIDNWTSHNRYAGGFTFYHSRGKSREANAQGTIGFGGTSVALDYPYWGQIYFGMLKIMSVSR
jgi:hypothetical protein